MENGKRKTKTKNEKITKDFIMSYGPCEEYPESRVTELIGEGKTPLEILRLNIPPEDRLWVLTRPGAIPGRQQREFARKTALPVARARGASDVVMRYLETGEEWLREEAHTVAVMESSELWHVAELAVIDFATRDLPDVSWVLSTSIFSDNFPGPREQINFFKEILEAAE